jgi:hypothetical protein
MNFRFVPIVFAISLILMSCGSSELSRGSAEEFIEASEQVKSQATNVVGNSGYLAAGDEQGLWTIDEGNILLTPRAAKEISGISGSQIFPVENSSINVIVTGIAENPSSEKIKTAEFTWKYENISPLVRRLAVSGGNGVAIFQLYDDGWRLSTVDLKLEDQPATLSAKEQADLESDIAAETERKASEIKAMNALWSGGKTRHTLYFNPPGTSDWYRTDFTDNAMVSYSSKSRKGPWQLYSSYWYGIMSQPDNHTYGSNSQPGTIRMMLWQPGGGVNYVMRTYDTMGLSVAEFLSILIVRRDRWRELHAGKLDGGHVRAKYSYAYYALHTVDGLNQPEIDD